MFIKRFDRDLYKKRPDQMVLRLNEIANEINSRGRSSQQQRDDTNDVIITGMQPDGSFGVKHWKKNGDLWELVDTIYDA